MPIALLLSLLLLTVLLPAGAVAAPDEEAPLLLRAGSLQHTQADDLVAASGGVELEWGGSRLYADMARYYRKSGDVEADGDVRLLRDGDVFTGDSVSLNLESQTGVINNGRIFIRKNNLHFTGRTIEKRSEQEFRVDRATLTTCDGDNPGWKFRADDVRLAVDDIASGKNALFYLGDLPVFWFPYLIFPARTERQSGFLIPKTGHSSKKGLFLEVPYYWAVSPSQDATVTLDYQSSRGVGLGLEHRYLGRSRGRGESRGFLIYDQEEDRFRGNLSLQQQAELTERIYWRADVNVVLDRDFYRDYGSESGEYNRQYLGSAAFFGYRSGIFLATAGVDYLRKLDLPDDNSTPQKLPYLMFSASGERLSSSPLYYAFNSSLTHFDRDSGPRGERLLLAPELTLQGAVGETASGRLRVGYQLLGYNAENAGSAGGLSADGTVRAEAMIRTSLGRVYEGSVGGYSRFRHLLVPEASYSVTERKSLQDLPFFDYDDRPLGGQMLNISLRNLVTGKSVKGETAVYRDLLRFDVSQGYQLSGERRELLLLVDHGRPFTDTALTAELLPLPGWRLFSDNRISPYHGNLTNASLEVEAGDPLGSRASLGYHHAEGELDYLEGRAAYADFKPFLFSALARYSFDRPGFLETLYSVEYKQQCWGLLFSYRDRLDNTEFSATFTLSGLGAFKLL